MVDIRVAGNAKAPKAVVLLFGWLGAEDRHLAKYAAMWTGLGALSVRATAPSADVMLGRSASLLALGFAVLEAAAAALAAAPDAPLVVHTFSNGGSFVWEQLRRVASIEAPAIEEFQCSAAERANIAVVRARLKAEIFDSTPCYLHLLGGVRAIGTAVPHPVPRLLLQAVFFAYAAVGKLLLDSRPAEFWRHWFRPALQDSSLLAAAVRQLFIYSPLDELCDVDQLEVLVAARGARSLRFEDTGHVSHYKAHPKEYAAACAAVVWP